jgi:GntR family transcriptional repressor for pyruvate dehydrogenase complex
MTRRRVIIEMGMGNDLHGMDYQKAATRAIQDAIRHSTLPIFGAIGMTPAQMEVNVTIGVQNPKALDCAALAKNPAARAGQGEGGQRQAGRDQPRHWRNTGDRNGGGRGVPARAERQVAPKRLTLPDPALAPIIPATPFRTAPMPFQKVTPEKLSTAVTRQIEKLILRGILRPGERLPSERELAEKLGVSRPSLREAVAELQDKGLLTSRAGAGIFVADVLGSAFSPALIRLFADHDEAVFDYIAFRRDLEGLAAERAARLASDTDLRVVQTVFEKMEAAHTKRSPKTEAELDAEFHMAIIEASHNVVMLHMMRSMFQLLQEGVFYNRQVMFKQRTTRGALLDQHRAINAALQARDGEAARAAVTAHLDYVENSLADQQKADRNEAIARQRFEHEQSR